MYPLGPEVCARIAKWQLNKSLGKSSFEGRLKTEVIEKIDSVLAGTTGFEPATSDVTGRRSNQLNYVPALNRTVSS
jgi:hypothetical protein